MSNDPWRIQRWAFDQTTGNAARKAVLSMLAMQASPETGRCEAKQGTLAMGCELSERAVRSHLKALEADGFIARRPQFRRDRGRRGDEFLLLAPWVDEWPDGDPVAVQPADGAGGASDADSPGGPEAGGRTPRKPASGQELPPENDHRNGASSAAAREREFEIPEAMRADAEEALKQRKKAGTRLITERELEVAAAGLAAFNRLGDSRFELLPWVERIVLRLRNHPSWDAEKHVRLVESAWRLRWWAKRGSGKRPDPRVIWSRDDVFERVAHDAEEEAAGRTVTIEMSLKERRYSGGRTWDELTANEQAAAKENASMGLMPEDHRKVRSAPSASSEPWNPEPLTVENF